MNKFRNFEIALDCPNGLIKAGEILKGRLIFSLTESITLKEVTVTIHGRSEVSFQAGKYTYSKKEKYIKEVKTLFPLNGSQDSELGPGDHSLDFEQFIPPNVPTSFEGKYGHVRYSIDAKLDRGIWKPAITKIRKFIVKNELDLNNVRGSQEPIRLESSAVDGCCFWRRGDVEVFVRLARNAYVPGESVLLDVDVHNSTDGRGHVSVDLVQFTTFHTRSGSKRWRHTIYTRPRTSFAPGETLELSQEPIPVPPLPPSGLPGCKLVDIIYTLRVKVKVKGLECKIPINLTIGTIPLRSVFGGPILTPPPYQQDPEPFSLLWNQPASPSTSSTSPSPWEPPVTPWDLPPSPPGYTPVTSPGPLAIEPPSYEESQRRSNAGTFSFDL
ncbi:arrestin domain-containing protein 2-like [Liolophura sinensis]|uniref:arrestin domain-containing protein 2-like n=1 Tax=Liolophura sinensis TaxID=3198878 RepID=UPI0031591FEC